MEDCIVHMRNSMHCPVLPVCLNEYAFGRHGSAAVITVASQREGSEFESLSLMITNRKRFLRSKVKKELKEHRIEFHQNRE